MKKLLKSRNPIASAVTRIRCQVIPDKREKKMRRLDHESLRQVRTQEMFV